MGLLDRFRRHKPAQPEVEDDLPDPASPEQLHELFGLPAGTPVSDDGRSLTLEPLDVGEVAFPSGRVAFCDPFLGDGTMFVAVAPGTVGRASVLGIRLAPDHVRVAAFALDLAPGPVSTWAMYVPEGESVDEGSIWGFAVDAGLACFADPTALDALHAAQARYYEGPMTGHEPVVDDMDGGGKPVLALIYEVEPGLQLAISQSGWGDGLYATYVGTDAGGRLARLMISFDALSATAAF
jgi:hypothetical protein